MAILIFDAVQVAAMHHTSTHDPWAGSILMVSFEGLALVTLTGA